MFQPKILIVGTGAIGGFYGGKLALAGAHVSAVCRSDYETVKTQGIEVSSPWGDFRFMPQQVVRHPSHYNDTPDYILVAMKVLPQARPVELIKDVVGPSTAIVLLQNGIHIEGPIAGAFPDNEIISGLAFIGVSRTGPGRIRHQDYGRLTLGNYPGGVSEKTRLLGALLDAAGVPCEITPDVQTARWRKLVWNAPFNPVSVLAGGVDTAVILGSEETVRLIRSVMEEVCRIAEAHGHGLPDSIVDQNIEGTRAMSAYKTSMLLDFEAGRPMEVEAIVGNAVRAAREKGIETPHLESLYALLAMLDSQRREHAR